MVELNERGDQQSSASGDVPTRHQRILSNALIVLLLVLILLALTVSGALFYVFATDCRGCSSKPSNFNVSYADGFREVAEILRAHVNLSVNPCEDFYEFACGKWLTTTEIPSNRAHYSQITILTDSVSDKILDLFASSKKEEKPIFKTLRKIFAACINVLNENGTEVREYFSNVLREHFGVDHWPISTLPDGFSLENSIGTLSRKFQLNTLMKFYVFEDEHNSSVNMLHIDKASLGLGPSTEMQYENKSSTKILAYQDLMRTIAKIHNGENSTEQNEETVQNLLMFESHLAFVSARTDVKARRNSSARYNKFTVANLQLKYPTIDFYRLFEVLLPPEVHQRTFNDNFTVIVACPEYLHKMSELIENMTATENGDVLLANYFIWRFIQKQLSTLDEAHRQANSVYEMRIMGKEEAKERPRECVEYVVGSVGYGFIGFATGRLFVDAYFTPEVKLETQAFVERVIESFYGILQNSDWLDNETRNYAIAKVHAMKHLIGYPEWLVNETTFSEYYKGFQLRDTRCFAEIAMKATEWIGTKIYDNIGRSTERNAFGGSPAIVNAWYYPAANTISFPAAVLQPPVYHVSYPKSYNYGSVAQLIGLHLGTRQSICSCELDTLKEWSSRGSMPSTDLLPLQNNVITHGPKFASSFVYYSSESNAYS